MFELTINGKVYSFNFGMGFMREINKTLVVHDVDGVKGATKNIGLRYKVALAMDGDVEALADILDFGNKGQELRITRKEIDAFIDDADTDIDKLFEEVMDFLRKSNATKKSIIELEKAVAAERAKNEN